MSTKAERAAHANQLIKAISNHGRRFFWFDREQRTASMEVNERGRVYFVDDYTGKRIDTHYRGCWRGFSHGGTLRDLVEKLRDYIRDEIKIPIFYIAPNRGAIDGNFDMWGYGEDACKALQNEVASLPIIQLPSGE